MALRAVQLRHSASASPSRQCPLMAESCHRLTVSQGTEHRNGKTANWGTSETEHTFFR